MREGAICSTSTVIRFNVFNKSSHEPCTGNRCLLTNESAATSATPHTRFHIHLRELLHDILNLSHNI